MSYGADLSTEIRFKGRFVEFWYEFGRPFGYRCIAGKGVSVGVEVGTWMRKVRFGQGQLLELWEVTGRDGHGGTVSGVVDRLIN